MIVRLLGSAAGGGLPQWNCWCDNCVAARRGLIPSRTQSSVAISADDDAWFFVNASPDIRFQLETLTRREQRSKFRATAFEAVLLNNADLDHTLGLLVAREGGPVTVYASDEVWRSTAYALGFGRILSAFHGPGSPGLIHRRLGAEPVQLQKSDGSAAGLSVRMIPLGGSPPRYDASSGAGDAHACALLFESADGERCLVALDVPGPDATLLETVRNVDLTVIDGTFWSDREMIELGFSSRTSSDMGHWPISGPEGSLAILSRAVNDGAKVIYSHINNTNPILDPSSEARRAVEAASISVGEDGMTVNL